MTPHDLQHFRDATAAPPVGAKERVWRRMQTPATSHRPRTLALAFAASALLGVGLVLGIRSQHDAPFELVDQHGIALAAQARITANQGTLIIDRGTLAISRWGAPLEVRAQDHLIRVESGVVLIRVASEHVDLEVTSGTATFDGVQRTRGARATPSSPLLDEVLRREPPAAHDARLLFEADQAAEERRYPEALRAYAELATSSSLSAEVAQFKQAELMLRQLEQPAGALALFDEGDTRFPSGALAQERALSAIESCVRLADWKSVEHKTRAFLAAHPTSERRTEVQRLHDDAQRTMNVSEGPGHSFPEVHAP